MNIVSIVAQHNAYIDQANQHTNYRSLSLLAKTNEYRRSLLRFNVSGQSISNLIGAKLRIYPASGEVAGTDLTVTVYRVLLDWSEGLVTWSSPWGTEGMGSGTDYVATPVGTFVIGQLNTQYYSCDITQLADLKATFNNNYGFVLMTATGTSIPRYIYDRDTAGKEPYLDLYYGQPGSPCFISDFGIL